MADITLSLACTLSDRTRPILDGRVTVPGVRFAATPGEPETIFRRALREQAFEVTELSMGSHIVTTARGDAAYVGVPVFLSRAFRHANIYVRTDRGIVSAADLRGRRVGLPEYQQTAAMWVRGMLHDTAGVAPTEIAWRTGGLDQPGEERIALALPPGLDVQAIPPGQTLGAMLAAGELDAVISPRPPACFTRGDAPVARLFADYRTAEQAYYRATGFFPIMHCLAIRRDVAAAHPWLAAALFAAFAEAKAMSMAELGMVNVLRVSLPWVAAEYAATLAIMGDNPWPYGYRANLAELAAMTRYAATDGLAARLVDPAELFDASALELADPMG